MTMTPAEVERKVRQLDNDVQSIYEMLTGIESTQRRHSNRFEELAGQVAAVADQVVSLDAKIETVDSRVSTVDAKVDVVDAKVDALGTKVGALESQVGTVDTKLDEVLRLLRADGAEGPP